MSPGLAAMTADATDRPRCVAVVGAGRMGRGIALACALAGVPSLLVDLKERGADDAARLAREAAAEIAGGLQFLASIGLLDAGRVPALAALASVVSGAAAAAELARCDLVFEGVPETLAAKRDAFAWLGAHVRPDTIIASTTSTLDVNELAALVAYPERFLNAHWLNPAHLMPLVEISVGDATAPATTARLRATLTALGKVPVVCKASPGYIVPRIQALAMNEAARLVEEGVASAEDIDTAVRVGFGLRFAILGLLEFIDWGGNDILYYASGHLGRTIDADRYRAPEIIEHNMREGRNGLREGQGFYDYRDRDVDAYRRLRLEQFVGLVGHLGLLPPGLRPRGD
jgi:3-hydroxybutyryl-CoA dehydrogenase